MFERQLRSASVRPRRGLPGEIGAEAVGRTEARPLANQHHHEARAQGFADRIADRDAALLHHRDGSHAPRRVDGAPACAPVLLCSCAEPAPWRRARRQHLPQERRGVPVDGARREAIDDREGDVEAIGAIRQAQRVEGALRRLVQLPSEVWPLQVRGAVRRGTAQRQRRRDPARRGPARTRATSSGSCTASRARACASWKASCVAVGRLTPARPSPTCAGVNASQCTPGVGNDGLTGQAQAQALRLRLKSRTSSRDQGSRCSARAKAGGTPAGCSSRRAPPPGARIAMRSSHASNSGAGRSPSTRRTYSASWNDVLW